MKLAKYCASFALAAIVFGGLPAAAADITLRFASVANESSTWAPAQETFKREFEARTDGRVEVQIFNNNTLGSNREALELAKNGAVDFVLSGTGHATRYAPLLNSVIFPYMWKDRETMFKVLDGEIGDQLSDSMNANNMSIIAYWDNGFRHVSNNKGPINKPEDIKGLKLRTLPSSVHVTFFKALGAVPTPMGFSELVPALQQGVIDGQENPPGVVYPYRLFEAQKYYSLTGHVNEPMLIVMSNAARDKLSEEDLKAMEEAIAIATEEERRLNDEKNSELLELLRKEMEVNEVPDETIEQFRTVAKGIYDEAIADLGEGGQELIDALNEANK
ncbi:TRAP transporter substrate-binding protein [Tepidamorphus sp. 3E244]|uniref:TRAP transporter substrate-binding protein n=1 Tax=Tepidamorphus sp. 3E244 TaxID=3385498 RepID=UPI0038FC467A